MGRQRKMASLRGLEPPTLWFVATRSIQLSYRLAVLGILPRTFWRLTRPNFDDLARRQTRYPAELRAHPQQFHYLTLLTLLLQRPIPLKVWDVVVALWPIQKE